eukprot:7218962-Prymnesium_polylepis.1
MHLSEQARTLEQITDVLMSGEDDIAGSPLPEDLVGSVASLVSEANAYAMSSCETGAGDGERPSFYDCAKDAGCGRLLAELTACGLLADLPALGGTAGGGGSAGRPPRTQLTVLAPCDRALQALSSTLTLDRDA